MRATVAAVDLGAASGRVMLADVSPDAVALTQAHRFDNGPVRLLDTLGALGASRPPTAKRGRP